MIKHPIDGIQIDPEVSFGQPCIKGTGITTEIIAGRLKSGESVEDLTDDYSLPIWKIEDALRWELQTPYMKEKLTK